MNGAILGPIVAALVALLLVGLAGIVLLASRYRITPKNVKLPFMDFEVSRFTDLSAVKLFNNVSSVTILPSASADSWLRLANADISPILLVHVGWQIVSGAFLETYLAYPSEENVARQADKIGTQNAEFVVLFERIYRIAIRQDEALPMDFAREYFLRAPSLATRIADRENFEDEKLFRLIAQLLPSGGSKAVS